MEARFLTMDKAAALLHRIPLAPDAIALVQRWREVHRKRIHAIGAVLAGGLFAGGLVWSLIGARGALHHINILPCILLFVLVQPLGLIVNVAEFHIMTRMADVHIGWRAALRTVIYARAAAFLPIPGGLLTRIAALHQGGASLRKAGGLTVLLTVLAGAAAFGYSGLWLASVQAGISAIFLVIAIAALGICVAAFRALNAPARLVVAALIARLTGLVIESVGLMLALRAVGLDAGFGQAATLVISTFVGTAVSVAPGGLGIREGTVALLAPLVAIAPATGFLAATVTRITGMGILLVALGAVHKMTVEKPL